MGGICGVFAPTGDADESLLKRMNAVQHHRGPDSEGYATFPGVGLAVKRLRIIDLTSGDQPISNEDGAVTVVCDGVIYNFLELRSRLTANGHTFRTNSDTEVIVHLYEEKGEAFLKELLGMFAIALWDRSSRRLILARDRLGIKPLYYRWDGERLLFASEIKGILADPEVPRNVDQYALRDYLAFQTFFGDKTLFEGIRTLEPARYLVADGGRVSVRPYWDLTFSAERSDADAFVARYKAALEDSVQMQMVGEVPLGSPLSGIDSICIAAIAAKRREGLPTFSLRLRGAQDDGTEGIWTLAHFLRTDHHEREVDSRSFSEVFPRIMYHLDEPLGGPAVFLQWQLSEFSRTKVGVALTGCGGDEVWGGPPGVSRSSSTRSAGNDLEKYGREAVLQPDELQKLLPPEAPTTAQLYDPRRELDKVIARSTGVAAADHLLYLNTNTHLASILVVDERLAMAHSLEDRMPFLDSRIVDLSGRVPSALRVARSEPTNLQRLLVASYLPKNVVDNETPGHTATIHDWLRSDLRPYCEREVLDGGLGQVGLDEDVVHDLLERQVQGAVRTDVVWALLSLAVWHRVVLDGRAV